MNKDFKKVMSLNTDAELIKIVTIHRMDYQPEAVKCAEEELNNRNLTPEIYESLKEEVEDKEVQNIKIEKKTVSSMVKSIHWLIDKIGYLFKSFIHIWKPKKKRLDRKLIIVWGCVVVFLIQQLYFITEGSFTYNLIDIAIVVFAGFMLLKDSLFSKLFYIVSIIYLIFINSGNYWKGRFYGEYWSSPRPFPHLLLIISVLVLLFYNSSISKIIKNIKAFFEKPDIENKYINQDSIDYEDRKYKLSANLLMAVMVLSLLNILFVSVKDGQIFDKIAIPLLFGNIPFFGKINFNFHYYENASLLSNNLFFAIFSFTVMCSIFILFYTKSKNYKEAFLTVYALHLFLFIRFLLSLPNLKIITKDLGFFYEYQYISFIRDLGLIFSYSLLLIEILLFILFILVIKKNIGKKYNLKNDYAGLPNYHVNSRIEKKYINDYSFN